MNTQQDYSVLLASIPEMAISKDGELFAVRIGMPTMEWEIRARHGAVWGHVGYVGDTEILTSGEWVGVPRPGTEKMTVHNQITAIVADTYSKRGMN